MSEFLAPAAEFCAGLIEALGILIITGTAIFVLLQAALRLARSQQPDAVYSHLRLRLGHGILIGLEFLVAADIIHTVAVELTFASLGALGIVVLIRTFLSFTLELEVTGRWPWQTRARQE